MTKPSQTDEDAVQWARGRASEGAENLVKWLRRTEERPSGAEARVLNKTLKARLKQLGEKARRSVENMKCKIAAAKARLVLQTLLARLKPCPCYKARSIEFFTKL